MNQTKLITLFSALLLSAACQVQDDTTTGPRAPLDDGSISKADSLTSNVEINETSEELRSGFLRSMVCTAIADSLGSTGASVERSCDEHTFTVTKKYDSKLYLDARDNGGLTVGLDVLVETADRGDFNASLKKNKMTENFALTWSASVDRRASEGDAFVKEIAEHYQEWIEISAEHQDNLAVIRYDDLPLQMQVVVDGDVESIHEQGGWDGVGLFEAYEITTGGEVVGYAMQYEMFVDHPLFDGAGETVYYTADGEQVDSFSWEG